MNLHGALDPPGSFWVTVEFSTALAIGVAFLLFVLWFASLLVTVGSGELAKPEWDLEWLITLPSARYAAVGTSRRAQHRESSGAIALIPRAPPSPGFQGFAGPRHSSACWPRGRC